MMALNQEPSDGGGGYRGGGDDGGSTGGGTIGGGGTTTGGGDPATGAPGVAGNPIFDVPENFKRCGADLIPVGATCADDSAKQGAALTEESTIADLYDSLFGAPPSLSPPSEVQIGGGGSYSPGAATGSSNTAILLLLAIVALVGGYVWLKRHKGGEAAHE